MSQVDLIGKVFSNTNEKIEVFRQFDWLYTPEEIKDIRVAKYKNMLRPKEENKTERKEED